MKITVCRINKEFVFFFSKYGSALGVWKDCHEPRIKSYCVEIDIPTVIGYDDIKILNNSDLKLSFSEEKIFISAVLSEYNDGCITLQFDNEFIECIAQKDDRFKEIIGKNILFTTPLIEIYDEDII